MSLQISWKPKSQRRVVLCFLAVVGALDSLNTSYFSKVSRIIKFHFVTLLFCSYCHFLLNNFAIEMQYELYNVYLTFNVSSVGLTNITCVRVEYNLIVKTSNMYISALFTLYKYNICLTLRFSSAVPWFVFCKKKINN